MKKHAIQLFVATACFALLCTPSGVAVEKNTEDMGIYLGLFPDHLTYDPHETKNLAQKHTEIVARLTRRTNQWWSGRPAAKK